MADLVGYSFRPSESLVSIHPSFFVFLASLWVVLEVNLFVWAKIDFWPHFSPLKGPARGQNGRFGGVFVPAVRVPSVHSSIFFGVSGIIVGNSRGKSFCLGQN